MSLRLIEFIAPADLDHVLADLPNARDVLGRWDDRLDDDMVLVRMLVHADQTEEMLDDLEERFPKSKASA